MYQINILKYLIRFYFLAFPFYSLGPTVGNYIFSLPTIICIVTVVYLYFRKFIFNKLQYSLYILLILWFICTNIFQGHITNYLYSLGSFFLMSSITLFQYDKNTFTDISKFIIGGFLLTLPFAFYDILVTLIGIIPLEDSFPYMNFDLSRSYFVGSIYRVKSTFQEPSYYAIYLASVFYFLIDIEVKFKKTINVLIIVLLLLTLSLTGYVLLFFILFSKKYNDAKSWFAAAIFIALLVVFAPDLFSYAFSRLGQTFDSVINNNYVGSEGSRANSIFVMFDYFQNGSTLDRVLGEGYANYSDWLIENFSYFDNVRIAYARGQINNAIAAIGISTGLIGLFLYSAYFYSYKIANKISTKSLILHILVQFSYAFLIGYMFWGILLIFIIKDRYLHEVNYS